MLGFAPLGGIPLGGGDPGVGVRHGPVDLNVIMTVGLGLHDTAAVKWTLNILMPEGLGFSPDAVQGAHDPVFIVVGENIGVAQADVSVFFRGANITEGIAFSSIATSPHDTQASIIERFRIILTDAAVRAQAATAADTVGIASTLLAWYGVQVREIIKIRSPLIVNQLIHLLLSDAVEFAEVLRQLFALELTDNVAMSGETRAQQSIRMLEAVEVASTLGSAAAYNITLRQVMRLRDSLADFFGAEISEDLGIGDALAARALASAGIVEEVGIAGSLVPKLLLHVTTNEGVEIDPGDAVRMLLHPTMREGVEMKAGYLSPGGNFTTWVMNTRTGGVTEYQDYVFNSFAQMGRKYLGATDTGLYELLGDDDAGDAIVSHIKGGYMQFGGTQLSRLKEAYIAARGEGDWVLKIITGDDVYNYSVSNRNMRSTKFHMGKGQRSRYFAFELISAGQDFDLDTLEFVPIVVQRRV